MSNIILSDVNLKNLIESLKISEEQKSFLIDELPHLDKNERLELLDTLRGVYFLNEEENQAIKKIQDNLTK